MYRMNIKANENNISVKPYKANSIGAFYDNTAILVTGATGFIGKGILEKLMRVCPNIAAIYVLIRPKKDQTIEQRFKELIDDPIYDSIKVNHPSLLSRIHLIQGDVSLPDLGLSPADRTMLIEKVNIVFHLAATVRFNEPLNVAVNINTKGTARVIQLCKELKHVISVVHVSTAYSNAHLSEIEEKVYTTCFPPSTVIDICEIEDKTLIDLLEERILKIYPNTYTFTKNLAEQIVSNNCDCLPVAIVRPSIIGASLEEPCPGWVDNVFGATAVFLQVGRGILRAMIINKDARLDVVPIDYVIDTIMCAAWHVTLDCDTKTKVYNCTSNASPLKWGQLKDIYVECCIKTPMNNVLWYPFCILLTNRYVYNVLNIFLHILPAFIMDTFLKLRDKRPTMMKINNYLNQLLIAIEYFDTREWTFHRYNITEMMRKVKTLEDGNIVKLDLQDMDWKKYITNYQMGIKKFILKENSRSVNAARRLSFLYWAHQIAQVFGLIVFLAVIGYLALVVCNFVH
ncbi:putative fatty acyl-CoA reductase CG5065 isoform X1 [Frieseomelitta varia]|uniref:putative fatty acyl-CoA reductase CG5065 isoform X1 n=1 Tax=Frieseomelitta varia TaxID=561572 RepID=UPI001CB6809F|nr:putative fatty acyl-CoA reductase CG5065 isoform X1 [Frieseomelitta varia]